MNYARCFLHACLLLVASVPGLALALQPVAPDVFTAAVDRAYAQTQGRPLWVSEHGLNPAGRAVLGELAAAAARGLRPADYDAAGLTARADALASASVTAAALTEFDRELSRAAAVFISHLQRGRVRPQDAGYALEFQREPLDLAAALSGLAASRSPAATLDGFEPRYRHYALLKQALARYRKLAAEPDARALPPLPVRSIKPGAAYAAADDLRRRLVTLGDLAPSEAATAQGPQLDRALVTALAAFQARHGLAADGVLGASTLSALNVPLAERVRQIELSMERVRWLPAPPGGRFIIVNIPQFRLFAFRGPDDAEQAMTAMNVIVGKQFKETNTPVFMAEMRYVVFRPYWDVPMSIMRKEVLPHLRRDIGWADKEGFELVRGESDNSPVVAMSPDSLDALERGELRVRQRSSQYNALGYVKFMLPNPHNVYLHSTPAQRLFGEARRAFSHGCVRVEEPVKLAEFAFAGDDSWTRERIEEAMQGSGPPERYNLREPIPVIMFYSTAIAAEDGRMLFFQDIYRHDVRLAALLERRR